MHWERYVYWELFAVTFREICKCWNHSISTYINTFYIWDLEAVKFWVEIQLQDIWR